MQRQLALWFLLLPQPVVAFVLWWGMRTLMRETALAAGTQDILAFAATAVLYAVWSFMFARGFVRSAQAKRMGMG